MNAQPSPATGPWWKSATIYQVYPRSFADSNGDGVGDLEGIRRHLDHLSWLGVDAVWLSPFYRSPMRDFGYDVADYCDVDPLFGDLATFDRLVAEAHGRGLRVLVDFVPNHSSEQHPWFIESRSSRTNPKNDWYIWRDGTPDRPPNNWTSAFRGRRAWTWDKGRGQWYLHMFLPQQPDLNLANPQVREALHDVMRFWLDRGVDGFRIDVAHGLGKDPALPDDPPELVGLSHSSFHNDPASHPILKGFRRVVDAYQSREGDRVLVGEVYLLDPALVAPYYGHGDELHLAFNFPPLYAPWDAGAWREQVAMAEVEFGARDAWPTWVLSNHDNPRHRTRYGSEERARAAAVLLLTLRGTPFIYAGEELGLEDAVVPAERVVDPGGRDGCRAPLPWNDAPDHGWVGTDPWLPWPPDLAKRNVEAQRADPGSILNLYRRLLVVRRESPALQLGDFRALPAPDGMLAFQRVLGSDRRAVVVNFADEPASVDIAGSWEVEVASDQPGEGEPYRGTVPGSGALVLKPGLPV